KEMMKMNSIPTSTPRGDSQGANSALISAMQAGSPEQPRSSDEKWSRRITTEPNATASVAAIAPQSDTGLRRERYTFMRSRPFLILVVVALSSDLQYLHLDDPLRLRSRMAARRTFMVPIIRTTIETTSCTHSFFSRAGPVPSRRTLRKYKMKAVETTTRIQPVIFCRSKLITNGSKPNTRVQRRRVGKGAGMVFCLGSRLSCAVPTNSIDASRTILGGHGAR